jgi:hypothetical protein
MYPYAYDTHEGSIVTEFGVPMKLTRLIKMCLNKTCSKVYISKHLSDMFPVQSGLKQRDDLLPLLFNSALEYAAVGATAQCRCSLCIRTIIILSTMHALYMPQTD